MLSKFKTTCLMAGALLVAVPGGATAETSEIEQMRAEMAQMRAEMAQLRAEQQGDWMAASRRAEIEGMIADVFADAENRATLLQEGAMAGIDEKGKIFLQSADGGFSAQFSGQIQHRYIWNSLDTDAGRSESISGFQARRQKFGIRGKMGDGWGYKLVFATNRDSGAGGGNAFTEDVYITKKLNDNFSILVGTNKLPFARQEIISSTRMVAVDRSPVTEFFTLNRSDQATLIYKTDDILAHLALSDGGNRDFTDFNNDLSNDFAVTGRVEWKVMGDNWKEATNEFGGVDEDHLFLAGAFHYQSSEGTTNPESGLAWTAEVLYKTGPWGLSTALFGNHTDNGTAVDTDQFGLYAQASYELNDGWDIFAQWNHLDDDGVGTGNNDPMQAIVFGANKHFSSRVKFTADVIWVYAGDDQSADGNFINGGELSDGIGLGSGGFTANDDHDDQIALRLQLQLLF
ncbi:MAG: porin [Phycisphaeraceae bacterium]